MALSTSSAAAEDISNHAAGSDTQTIKVLIYNGTNAAPDSVVGIKSVLDSANTQNLVPGYYFTYSTSPNINTATLNSYNVLAMPGGNDYITDYEGKTIDNIDPTAIKNFVNAGGGYLGICAGAFSGANYTENCYKGWGVAPNINCLQAYAEKNTDITITNAGKGILGQEGTITTLYWNGPAMTVKGNAFVMATYDGVTNSSGQSVISSGMAAIVGDNYGQGRSALVGPHPELDPKSPSIMAKLFVWVSNIIPLVGLDGSPPSSTTNPSSPTITNINPLINTVNAQTTINTKSNIDYVAIKNNSVPMKKTGLPILYLLLAIITIASGVILSKNK